MAVSFHAIQPEIRENKVQIGDFVPKTGIYTKPGVVVEKKENGDVVVDTNPVTIDKYHRYTITTGLTPENKEKFNAVMDSVINMKTNDERLNYLQNTIDELKTDPANNKITQTLHNQQAVLIRMARELPKVYQVSSEKISQNLAK